MYGCYPDSFFGGEKLNLTAPVTMLRDIWTRFGDNNVIAIFRTTCKAYRDELVPIPVYQGSELLERGATPRRTDSRPIFITCGKFACRIKSRSRKYFHPGGWIKETRLENVGERYGRTGAVIWSDHASLVLYIHRAIFGTWPHFTTAVDYDLVHSGVMLEMWEVPVSQYAWEKPGTYCAHYVRGPSCVVDSALLDGLPHDYDDNVIYVISAVTRHDQPHFCV